MKKCILFLLLWLPIMVHAAYPKDFATIDDEVVWMEWTEYESSSQSYKAIESKNQVAFGRYQFHYQYTLKEYLQRLYETDPDLYQDLKPFVESSDFESYFVDHKSSFVNIWKKIANFGDPNFENLQDEIAYEEYYLPTKQMMKQLGIDLDQFGPVIKGTVWSVAVRDGTLTNTPDSTTYQSIVDTYTSGMSDEEYLNKIMANEASVHLDPRWSNGQKNAALSAMNVETRPTTYHSNGIGGILGGALVDPYPNIFGHVELNLKKTSQCNTFLINRDGSPTDIKNFLDDLFFLIKIFSVVILVILSTIDYIKVLVKSDELKKTNQKTIKRMVITLIIFFLPDLLQLIFQIFGLYDISNCGIS